MSWLRRLVAREQMEIELDKELRFHFESQVADKVRSGIAESEDDGAPDGSVAQEIGHDGRGRRSGHHRYPRAGAKGDQNAGRNAGRRPEHRNAVGPGEQSKAQPGGAKIGNTDRDRETNRANQPPRRFSELEQRVSGLLLQTLRHETPSAPDRRWCQRSTQLHRSLSATIQQRCSSQLQISLLGRIHKTDPAAEQMSCWRSKCRCFYKKRPDVGMGQAHAVNRARFEFPAWQQERTPSGVVHLRSLDDASIQAYGRAMGVSGDGGSLGRPDEARVKARARSLHCI